jgi:MFS transporter, LPLT family, lysophospholipid transporter
MTVQFIAALADNTLLIVAIARLVELSAALWTVPLLKLSFVFSYVFLAPFVGPVADAWPKGRVMLVANFLKIGAVLLIAWADSPMLALGLAGLGAAIYAPAKYGLVCELLPPAQLVRANGLIEACTVCAVVLGTVLGGWLVSPWVAQNMTQGLTNALGAVPARALSVPADTLLIPALWTVLLLYIIAAALNLYVADSGARYLAAPRHPWHIVRQFYAENKTLWRDPLGRVSMSVTTVLWAVGATLQLLVLRWAEEFLGLTLDRAAYLQGVSALGVIVGAALASRWVSLSDATRLLPMGVALGLLVPCMALVSSVPIAAGLLVAAGGVAGFFVVPMNALLQHRGHSLLTAGRSIAVQGFNENAGILTFLMAYAALTALHVPLIYLIGIFGTCVTTTMLLILRRYRLQNVTLLSRH